MRAMILSAGLGTRLRPLTDSTPKPLVKLAGRPMIDYALELLEHHGFQEILLNVHYLADQLEAFVESENRRHKKRRLFLQDERVKILGSGGAIAKASAWLFEHETAALVCNADALMRPNLTALRETHFALQQRHGVGSTLAVMPHADAGRKYTGLRCRHELVEEFIAPSPEQKAALYLFPGVYIVEHWAAARLPASDQACSIVEKLWQPLSAEKKLGAWLYEGPYQDLGNAADIAHAEGLLSSGKF